VIVRKPRPGGQRRARGMCPLCGRDVALLKDGTVATRHLDPATRARCKGYGEKALPLPVEES
jgi:hypothetical protein